MSGEEEEQKRLLLLAESGSGISGRAPHLLLLWGPAGQRDVLSAWRAAPDSQLFLLSASDAPLGSCDERGGSDPAYFGMTRTCDVNKGTLWRFQLRSDTLKCHMMIFLEFGGNFSWHDL